MTFISYAQNFEDVILWRALKGVDRGFYIDVGANDPEKDSVTKAFYERGWHGINIEPVSEWYEKLLKDRANDINLQVAVGASNGKLILYEIPNTGLSTINQSFAKRHTQERGYIPTKIEVPVEKLTAICERYALSDIHFLKIDVEGAERDVIHGMDFFRFRPWILVIESNLPNSTEENYEEWEEFVFTANYLLAYVDGLNRFYVAKEHSELLSALRYPPSVFDGFMLSQHFNAELRAQQAEALATLADERAEQAEAATKEAEANAAQANERAEKAQALSAQADERAEQAEAATKEAEANAARANERAKQAEIATRNALVQYQLVINSHIWRTTAPLRWVINLIKWAVRGAVAWLTLKPGSRPMRTARLVMHKLRNEVIMRPRANAKVMAILKRFPRLKACLKRLYYANPESKVRQARPIRLESFGGRNSDPLNIGILQLYDTTAETSVEEVLQRLAAELVRQEIK